MGVVAEIERKLARQRSRHEADDDDVPELRTSTMTHVVWAPPAGSTARGASSPAWPSGIPRARSSSSPSPAARAPSRPTPSVLGLRRRRRTEVLSEVIELRLRGEAARHPASVVLPLLISDLPAFCRWRGQPDWGGEALDGAHGRRRPARRRLVGVAGHPGARTASWRVCSTGSRSPTSRGGARFAGGRRSRRAGPRFETIERLSVDGPKADALLLAGWLRSRLRRDVALTRRSAAAVTAVRVDRRADRAAERPRAVGRATCSRPSSTPSRATRSTRRPFVRPVSLVNTKCSPQRAHELINTSVV